ncbi:MAG TPA: ABC transporter substrate-binding protein, partial [Propionibacteriaceae bacterium]
MSVLRILANHEMLSLQPNDAFSDSSAATPILKLICPGLLDLDASGNIVPSVARTWTASSDKTTFRFQLQPGLLFSNGHRADGEAVAVGIERSLDPRRNSLHTRDLETISSVRAISATELEISTSEPFPLLPWYLAWRHYTVADSELQPIGLGPYQLERWNRGDSVQLVRNPNYQIGPSPHFDEIHVTFAPTSRSRRDKALSRQFDFIETLPPSLVDDSEFNEYFNVIPVASGSRTVLAFNSRTPGLATAARRAGLASLLDLPGMRAKIFGVPQRVGANSAPTVSEGEIDELRQLYSVDILRLVAPNISPVQEVAHELEGQLAAHGIRLSV